VDQGERFRSADGRRARRKRLPDRRDRFVLMRKATAPRRARAALNFFEWSLDKGALDAAGLGYVPLPPALVTQVKDYWAKSLKQGT
jgi:phosphate transport system substrate-binding protein